MSGQDRADREAEGESTASGYDALPSEQKTLLRRAIRLEWTTLALLGFGTVLVFLVSGQSQAMKAAFLEDLISLLPPIAFLFAARRIRKESDRDHPYGHHRSIGVAHLVAAAALLAMGGFLLIDSAMSLLQGSRPPIGLTVLFGVPIWSGWLMVAVMLVTTVIPLVLGRRKLKLAPPLHDKVLFADADMNKADWSSALATIVGVLGVGAGLWWADSTAAILVSFSILHDGVKNMRAAVGGLTDVRARTFDDREPHPLTVEVEQRAAQAAWVAQAVGRVRDQGHLFHVEMFVVPYPGLEPTVDRVAALRDDLDALDWKIHDVVIAPVPELPPNQAFRDD